jgi:hypothetical protein
MNVGFLEEQIPRRKSIRQYDMSCEISAELIDELCDFLSELTLPQTAIDWNFDTLPYNEMVGICATEPGVKAPMYLVLRAEKNNFCLQNTGYLGEMAALWLCSRGIGTCWQGGITVNEDFPDTLPYIASLAFGYPKEPFRTGAEEAKRKPLKKTTVGEFSGVKGLMAEAVRLAPSAMNRQPVNLMALEGKINVFRNHVMLNNPIVSYVQCIDVGCALAHMQVIADAHDAPFTYTRTDPAPAWGNKIYQTTIMFE